MRLLRRAALPGAFLALMTCASGIGATPAVPMPPVGDGSAPLRSAAWQPLPSPNAPDVAWDRRGLLQLSLGAGATDVLPSTPFYWASVTRVVDVDTDKFPILAVRAVNLTGPSWWDVEVQGATGLGGINGSSCPLPYGRLPAPSLSGNLIGTEVKTPSLDHNGMILFDLQAQQTNGLFLAGHRLRLRLSVAGTAAGGAVDYDGLRFLSREEAARLR